jgi:formiminotetrahydrofolate cyclodeaminase|tara:strand:- start:392 stop:736 length:345 start_codon:yes stop_codon:yes gene_type:complete
MKTQKKKYVSFSMTPDEYSSSKIPTDKCSVNSLVKSMFFNFNKLPKSIKEMLIKHAQENAHCSRGVELTKEQTSAFNQVKKAFDLTGKSDNDRAALRGALRKAGIKNLTLNIRD